MDTQTEIKENNKRQECIYVFDFDDTLVFSQSFIYIFQNENGEEKLVQSLTPNEYYEYDVQPNQRVDYSEFDGDKIPEARHVKINKVISKILLEAIEKFGKESVCICSARINPRPIQNIIETHLGLSDIKVDAVGYQGSGINSTPINAIRKRDYIKELVLRVQPETVYFYDDNMHNLLAVQSLNKEDYIKETGIRIRCIQVEKEKLTLIKE